MTITDILDECVKLYVVECRWTGVSWHPIARGPETLEEAIATKALCEDETFDDAQYRISPASP